MSAAMRSCYQRVMGREIHYTEWGAPDAPVLLAAHGLARTGRDMDELAQYFADRYRVLCPDTIGRGLSEWSPHPDDDYCLAVYAAHAAALMDALGIDRLRWVGTSMGGAIGTVAAAGPLRGRITHLVLNDNAPELDPDAIGRIREYAGRPASFATVTELEAYFRQVYRPYGWLSDSAWRRLTETSARRLPDGRVTPHYDPAIVRQFHRDADDYRIWDAYASLDCPVLCLRGVDSDLVRRDTVARMRTCRPRLTVIEIPDCGHAPALNVPSQLDPIATFLA